MKMAELQEQHEKEDEAMRMHQQATLKPRITPNSPEPDTLTLDAV